MNIQAMHELIGTREYVIQIRPVNETWVIQIQRKNSDRRFELETKRGDRRYFKTLDAAMRVCREFGMMTVEVWNEPKSK